MSIVLISDDDHSRFACEQLARQLRHRGQSCLTVAAAPPATRLSPLPPTQPDIAMAPEALLASPVLEQASSIGVFLHQPEQLERFVSSYRALARLRGQRPVPIFSGALQASLGDRLVRELHERLCCDLLLLTGERQLQALRSITSHWPASTAAPRLLPAGLWFAPERPPLGCLNGGKAKPPHHLVALVQERAPTAHGGKSQLLRQLIQWAAAAPEWTVAVQRDEAWEQGDPWIPLFDPEEWSLPANLVFAAPGQLLSQLAHCSACLTISSPWAMTAMAWGRRTMLVGDYGIHTNEGTTSWFGCGSMHRMRSLQGLDQLLELPATNPTWLESMGWGIHDGIDRLIQALQEVTA